MKFIPNLRRSNSDPASSAKDAAASAPSSTIDASHIEAADFAPEPWLAESVTGAPGGEDRTAAGDEVRDGQVMSSRVLTKDEFATAFRALMRCPNLVVKPPLRSLIIDAKDEEARAASDALYDIAVDVPWLGWLIEPSNIWIQRCLALGFFGFKMTMAVQGELAARRDTEAKTADGGSDDPPAPSPAPEPVPEPVVIGGKTYSGELATS